MAVRGDIYVDWDADPRIIWVESPSVELTVQDLVDTCRSIEADTINMAYPFLISAAGKEPLGGGVFVGITATLQNAVVAFEARPGPTYEQCNISGGNLVAVDENGDIISPIFPTAFTQVVRTSSSSATLLSAAELQYSSYNGGVMINTITGSAGTAYPIGTQASPVNNLIDAMIIAEEHGFHEIFVQSNLIIDNLNCMQMEFIGVTTGVTVSVNNNSTFDNCSFTDCILTGHIVGPAISIRRCAVAYLTFGGSYLEQCSLTGLITLTGADPVYIVGCLDASAAGISGPHAIVDMTAYTGELSIRDYYGDIGIQNKTVAGNVVVDLRGTVRLDSTVTTGAFILRGIGTYVNAGTPASIDASGLMSTGATWDESLAAHTVPGSMADKLKKDLTTGNFLALK
jgi:hypothetical protein